MNTREHGPTGHAPMVALTVLFALAWLLHLSASRVAEALNELKELSR